MKKLLSMVFPLLVLTGCQSVQQVEVPEEDKVEEPLTSNQMDLVKVAEPVLSREDNMVNHDTPVTETITTPMLNSDNRANELLLGLDLNVCQHRLTSLGTYDKKSFARYQSELDKNITLINKYLSVRNTLSEPAAVYFDAKYKASLDMTCAKTQHQVDNFVNRSVQVL